MHKTILS